MQLIPCPACHRHVKIAESECPFCHVQLVYVPRTSENTDIEQIRQRIPRYIAAATVTLTVNACSSDAGDLDSPAPDSGVVVSDVYGIAADMGFADTGMPESGVLLVDVYGIAPDIGSLPPADAGTPDTGS